jgi:predicted ArsR family transcriptional regulator
VKTPIIRISKDQLRALSNPIRLEIHTLLRTDGPLTAKGLAQLMGVDEMSLYYHLRLLTGRGLVQSEQRPGATKPETLYSVRARFRVEGLNLHVESNLQEQIKNIDSLLRAVSREQRDAGRRLRNEMHDRSMISRNAVRLTPSKFRELQRRLRELNQWLEENDSAKGNRYSVSQFVIPRD